MSFISYLLDFIYPPCCVVCNGLLNINDSKKLCANCSPKLFFIKPPYCSRCGVPLQSESFNSICKNCVVSTPLFSRNISPFIYDNTLRKIIYHFKYDGLYDSGYFLADMIYSFVQSNEPTFFDMIDIFVPVPLHKTRKKERGFNQAQILADRIGKRANISVVTSVLLRHKKTAPQSQLNHILRHENVKGAFHVENHSKINGKVVAIIDDILTTGSTLNDCAEILLLNGAKDVFCLTAAIAGVHIVEK